MNGVGFGAFTQGLAGGMSMGKSIKDAREAKLLASSKEAAPAQGSTGFDLGKPAVAGDVGSAQYAGGGEDSGASSWGVLGSIFSALGGGGASAPAAATATAPSTTGIVGSDVGMGIGSIVNNQQARRANV